MSVSNILLTASQVKLLEYLAQNSGADIYGYSDALDGRVLETLGLVTIVKAQKPPRNGAARQPYFGIMISDEGRDWMAQSGLFRRGLAHAW